MIEIDREDGAIQAIRIDGESFDSDDGETWFLPKGLIRDLAVSELPEDAVFEIGLHPNFPPFISRVRRLLTCPAKAYQVEVEDSACVIRLWPEIPAVFALHRLK
jgi:hypothetical protein